MSKYRRIVEISCNNWGIFDPDAIKEIEKELVQELALKVCPPNHPEPEGWRYKTAEKMLMYGDNFHKVFIRRDTVDIGDIPEAWALADQPALIAQSIDVIEKLINKYLMPALIKKKYLMIFGLPSVEHMQHFIKQELGKRELYDEDIIKMYEDFIGPNMRDPYGIWGALYRKFPPIRPENVRPENWKPKPQDGLPLFDSPEDWLNYLNRTTEPELTIGTLRVRLTRWEKRLKALIHFYMERDQPDRADRTGKGDPTSDPENDD